MFFIFLTSNLKQLKNKKKMKYLMKMTKKIIMTISINSKNQRKKFSFKNKKINKNVKQNKSKSM